MSSNLPVAANGSPQKLVNNFPNEISRDNFSIYGSSKNIFCLISEIFGSPMKLFLAEYAIFGRMPTLEYSTDTTKYPNGGEQVQEAIADFSKTKDLKAAMGWGPEYQYVSKLGEKGFFVHASDMAHNVAVLSNYKCGEMKKHLNNSVVKERKKMKKGVTDNNKHRIAFLMTDGDNIQWLMNSFVTNQNW